MRVPSLHALAEDGVGFIEQQQRVGDVGRVENALEVLLGLPDVLVDHLRKVDAVHGKIELARQDFRGHGLARARRPREEHRDAAFVPHAGRAPAVMDLGEGAHGLQHFLKLLALPRRQEQLGRPVETRRHALGEIADLQARRRAAGGGDHRGRKRAGHGPQAFRDALDGLALIVKTAGRFGDRGGERLRPGAQGALPELDALRIGQRRHFHGREQEMVRNALHGRAVGGGDEHVDRHLSERRQDIGEPHFLRHAGGAQHEVGAVQPAQRHGGGDPLGGCRPAQLGHRPSGQLADARSQLAGGRSRGQEQRDHAHLARRRAQAERGQADRFGQFVRAARRGCRAAELRGQRPIRKQQPPRHQLRRIQRRVPIERARGRFHLAQQAEAEQRMARIRERKYLFGPVPELLRKPERWTGAVTVVMAGRDHRSGSAVEGRDQAERQHECVHAIEAGLLLHPGERSAGGRAGAGRGIGRDLGSEVLRGRVRREEALFVLKVAHTVQALGEPIGERRDDARRRAAGALVPRPADLAAQAQHGLAQPVVRGRVRGRERRRENGIITRGGAHVRFTSGLRSA